VLITSDGPTPRVVDERVYEPFGQGLESFSEPGGFLDRINYALEPFNNLNKPTDPRTGWSYHGARWMAPQTARWLTPDPPVKAPDPTFMAQPWRMHPYQYVDQNPVVYWDPAGMQPETVGDYELAANGGYYHPESRTGEFVAGVVTGFVKAPLGLARDSGARVVDLTTMTVAATGKATGLWDVGYTEWSPEAQNYDPESSVLENVGSNVWNNTAGGVIDLGTRILEGDPEAIGAALFGAWLGKVAKGVPGKTSCFAAGTLVHAKEGLAPIEEVKEGDLVWSRDEATGDVALRRVLRTFVTPNQPVLNLTLMHEDGSVDHLAVTGEHPFYTIDLGWVLADDLMLGDEVVLITGDSVSVVSTVRSSDLMTVYNFEVDGFHTYFVGDRGAWVHNLPCARGGGIAKAINLPSWSKIAVDKAHIFERHVPGAKYSAGRSVFPATMGEKGIMQAIRQAYENGNKVGVQGTDRVMLRGQGGGLTIEMWFNKATRTIETAYPVSP
jgi:RHS repeat-associated protein